MPDDSGNFKPGGFQIRGRGGELRNGFRVVTDLGRWTADVSQVSDDDRVFVLVMSVRDHEPDPFQFEHAPSTGLKLSVTLGGRPPQPGEAPRGRTIGGGKLLEGAAKLRSRNPLVIEATLEVV